jgi:hypothetical protein
VSVAQRGGREPQAVPVEPSDAERMAQAAETVGALEGSVLDHLTGGAAAEWRHYPADEVYDPHTHAQYFYHAHPAPRRPAEEHGHFHLFLRADGMPPGVTPLLLPELAVANAPVRAPQAAPARRGASEEVAHLVAIALDRRGQLCRLFTTNRWVTGETWYRAADVIAMLDRFAIGETVAPAAANRWIVAVVQLFRPQIAALIEARDAAVMAWRRRWRTHVFEDRRLEIPSSLDIDLCAQLRLAAGDATPPRRAAALPPMAEGWADW